MPLEAKTVLEKQDIDADGSLGLRFAKVVSNDGVELSKVTHRSVLHPGSDVDAQLTVLSTDFVSQGYSQISAGDVAKVKSIVAAVWTPEVVSAFQMTARQ